MSNTASTSEKPFRVLQVFASLDRGGAETMVMNLYRKIDRTTIQFDFVANESDASYAYEEEIAALGGRVYKVPQYKIWNHFAYQKTWRRLLSDHPEWCVVHGHHTAPAVAYMPVARKLNRFTIAHSHTAGGDRSLKSNARRVLRFPARFLADVLFACSQSAAKWMFGSKSDQAHIINNAIDVENFAYDANVREDVRKEFGLKDEFVLGHVGRFCRLKNHAFMVKVFHEVHKQKPDARLLLVGDGELLNEVKDQVIQLGLEEVVFFAGVRADVSAVLSAMDVFVLPSLFEGIPVTLIEAQASGLPCVVSDAIKSEVFVTPLLEALSLSDSAQLWAERIVSRMGPDERGGISEAIIDAGYDVGQNAKRLEEFYHEVYNPHDSENVGVMKTGAA